MQSEKQDTVDYRRSRNRGGRRGHGRLSRADGFPSLQHEDMDGHPGHHTGSPSDGAFHRRFEDADKCAKEFDSPERDAWQKPEEILDALHLKRTSIVADIGAGTGYFSVRIAKRIPEGKIFQAKTTAAQAGPSSAPTAMSVCGPLGAVLIRGLLSASRVVSRKVPSVG